MPKKSDETKKTPGAPISNIERLVTSLGLEVEKSDVARLRSFIYQKVYDLLLAAGASAQANGRQLFEIHDIPVTRGLRQLMDEFKLTNTRINLGPFLEKIAHLPILDRGASVSAENALPDLIGALTLGLARSFKILNPDMTKPTEADWQKVEQIFDLLL